jgi:DNA-binding phage protein
VLLRVEMPRTKTIPWDTADYLRKADDIAGYMEAALEDGDPEIIANARETIARAQRPATPRQSKSPPSGSR